MSWVPGVGTKKAKKKGNKHNPGGDSWSPLGDAYTPEVIQDPGVGCARIVANWNMTSNAKLEVTDFDDMIGQIESQLEKRRKTNPNTCIKNPVFRGHVAPGTVFIGPNDQLKKSMIDPGSGSKNPAIIEKLTRLKKYMCPGGSITFWTCDTGKSLPFLQNVANITGVPVSGLDVHAETKVLSLGWWGSWITAQPETPEE